MYVEGLTAFSISRKTIERGVDGADKPSIKLL
jgi:hypothetical protein